MDASENLRGYAGDPNHSMHPDVAYNNSIITPGSYTFLTGALEAPPLNKEQASGSSQLLQQQQAEDNGGVETGPQSSTTSGSSLIGTLFTNHHFNNGRSSPPVPSSSNSWELTINGGPAGSLYAGGSNMPNILINGTGMMNNSTPTAQLLIGGLHGGSFNETDHGNVYYPPVQQSEAMQLIYVNGGYGTHSAYHPDRGSSATTLLYSSQETETNHTNSNNNAFGVSFLTSQRALEAAGAIPLMEHSRSYNNWPRAGGNEHSFLPVNDETQSHQSLFGAVLQARGDHDLSHMQHVQTDVMHVESTQSNNNISVNGQGLLSLSLSSHQPHFQGGQLPGDSSSEAHMAAALAKTKELASRYLASGANNADLSRFRTPSRDETRFHQESNSHVTRKAANNTALTASQFLHSVQGILNELCKVTPVKRTVPKPANSTEQAQYGPLRTSGSASVNASYSYNHAKEGEIMHGEGPGSNAGRGDPSDASHLVTVSHIPLQAEMMPDAARSGSGSSRDDLEFKKGQLIRMLDEVEARYRRYSDQLQVTCAGFNAQAGPNAATPYTILALQAMSRHFRCLKDAVKNQLKVVRRALGEEDVPAGFNGETSRLRYVDQQIRQQRALQQLGMLQQHAWRPQRGLPERAVSVLRAWLFEHFLHPYPKDVDKMSLAKQTGLTRSQVSNWFINARVRLWKPMVEEMYVEEQREAAELALQSDRIAREQATMHNNSNSPYEQYEGSNNNNNNNNNNRGRSNSSLQDELNNANGQQQSNVDFRSTTTDEGRDQDQAGPSSNLADVPLYRQQENMSTTAGEHTFNYEGRDAKRSKTALETVSDAFNCNSTVSSMLIMETKPEEEEARKLKGKSITEEQEQAGPGYVSTAGAFVSYNDINSMHRSYETVQGYPTASTGVSLTLGLRHCDANMRSSTAAVSVAPVLEKYDMDVDLARMDPLDREEYLHEGRVTIRDVHDNHGQYQHRGQQDSENPCNVGTALASPAFEHHHHHAYNDGH